MLDIITSVVITVGGIQAAMVLPEAERLATEEAQSSLIEVPAPAPKGPPLGSGHGPESAIN